MTTPSSTAGKVCVECNIPDTCLLDIITDFPNNKEHHTWSKEGSIYLNLLDEGDGCDGTITIISKCNKSGCPVAWMEEIAGGTSEALTSDGIPNKIKLSYKGQESCLTNITDIIDCFFPPYYYLTSVIPPASFSEGPATYIVVANGCYEWGQYVTIYVQPTIEFRASLGLSYELKADIKERSIKERRDERIKSRLAMEDTKPKNGNKLRDGWTYATDKFKLTNSLDMTFDYGLKICNTEYTEEYKSNIKNKITTASSIHSNSIDKLLGCVNKYFAPDPENNNKIREYEVFSTNLEPVTLGVSYAYQYTDVHDGPCHFFGLYGEPLLEGGLRFDIIQFICAYCKIDHLANKCRKYLDKHGVSVECYIEILLGININLGVSYKSKNDEWSIGILEKNQLYLGIKGVVSATFEAEVMCVELSLGAEGSIEAKAGFEVDSHDDGIDLVGYHDGVKGYFAFSYDVAFSDGDDGKEEQGTSTHVNKTETEWQLADPLKASESPLRANLYGKIRQISKPAITPPSN
ncbi:hypothetical protein N3R44_004773 [Escherichia coli]|nr:hypothetical protein [Escherichia coli]EGJ2808271.1 hypothetical protein [Escherichia coli]EGP4262882.1 hypothetical protein [Escherichia coli]EHG9212462.1 hypothetical protein [Escherichia coli]EHI7018227.1 hypothetical protein [Escherichia coli]